MQITFLSTDSVRIEPFLTFQRSHYQTNPTDDFQAYLLDEQHSLEPIQAHCQSWETLWEQNEFATRYNDPQAFLRTLAQYQPSDQEIPFAVLFSDSQTHACLVGWMAQRSVAYPLGVIKIKSLKMCCVRLPETGILCDARPDTWQAITTYLQAILQYVDHLEIPNLIRSHSYFQTITNSIARQSRSVLEPKVRWKTQLLDPDTGKLLQHRSSKTRSNLRRKEKRLAEQFEGDLRFIKIQDEAQVDEFLDHALRIASQTYQAALTDVGVADTTAYRIFLHAMAQAEMLRGYLLMGGSTPIAYVLGDVCHQTFTLWATCFLAEFGQRSPGIILLCKVQDDLAQAGVKVFDFGWGDAEYKRILSSEMQDEADVRVYAQRLKPTLAYGMDYLLSNSHRQLKTMLQSSGLFHQARDYWRTWLQSTQRKAETVRNS